MSEKKTARSIGDMGEDAVCDFLRRHGYDIIDRNFTVRGGEIDIIAEKNGVIAFVEVKTRKEDSLTQGEEAVTKGKIRRIVKTAKVYFNKLNEPCQCRFDVAVVQVSDRKVKRLRYYVSAFDASEQ